MNIASQAPPHECLHTCCVQQEFGNLFRCLSSGNVHVCDANCDQRLYNDRYSTICRVSKKLFPPFESDVATMDIGQVQRKRRAEEDEKGLERVGSGKMMKSQSFGP